LSRQPPGRPIDSAGSGTGREWLGFGATQVQSIPWKRAAEPSEIGRLAVFLASDDADYVTGSTYVIDGGLMQNQGQGA
jgi:NAD(P)-dependent dehydrogenase (short-subunit alcohol dehydrogenase family)